MLLTNGRASAADTFASYRSRFVYAQIDGSFANSEADIRLLVGSATLQDAAVLYRSESADDGGRFASTCLQAALRVSPNIAAVASQQARRDRPAWTSVMTSHVESGRASRSLTIK